MKTVYDQLMALPDPYNEMALLEIHKQGIMACLSYPSWCSTNALVYYFTWGDSEVGSGFWEAIYEEAEFHKTKAK